MFPRANNLTGTRSENYLQIGKGMIPQNLLVWTTDSTQRDFPGEVLINMPILYIYRYQESATGYILTLLYCWPGTNGFPRIPK